MTRRVSRDPVKRKVGRPTRLTDHTAEVILAAIERGNHTVTACALAHVGEATIYRWMERARTVEHAIATGQPYDRDDLRFLEFRERLAAARARAEDRAVTVVDRAMVGGFLISEKPAVDGNGMPIRDEDGKVMMERVWSQPDGRLALQYLGRARQGWAQQSGTQRIEVTGIAEPVEPGDEGGPDMDRVSSLVQRLALVAARRAEEPDEEFGEEQVFDAELVEDSGT